MAYKPASSPFPLLSSYISMGLVSFMDYDPSSLYYEHIVECTTPSPIVPSNDITPPISPLLKSV